MENATWTQISKLLQDCPSRSLIKDFATENGFTDIGLETLICIYSQRKLKLFLERKKDGNRWTSEMLEIQEKWWYAKDIYNTTILSIAQEVSLPPTQVARMVLEWYLPEYEPDLWTAREWRGKQKQKALVSHVLNDPLQLEDSWVAEQVHQAKLADDVMGPYKDQVNTIIGKVGEKKLEDWCKTEKVPYKSEDQMRQERYLKTPDVLLVKPIVVKGQEVRWIESKAYFGDYDWFYKSRKQFEDYLRLWYV